MGMIEVSNKKNHSISQKNHHELGLENHCLEPPCFLYRSYYLENSYNKNDIEEDENWKEDKSFFYYNIVIL